VLQSVAVCCSVYCRELYSIGLEMDDDFFLDKSGELVPRILQRVAVCCSILQCVAVCCSVLRRVCRESCSIELDVDDDGFVTSMNMCLRLCSVLQCVAVGCSVW